MYFNIDAIEREINKRGWDRAKFARKAMLSRSYVTKVMNKQRGGGLDFLEGLVTAFSDIDIRPFIIFERRGVRERSKN